MGERMDEHWHNLSIDDSLVAQAVSYTHLTLPTIVSV